MKLLFDSLQGTSISVMDGVQVVPAGHKRLAVMTEYLCLVGMAVSVEYSAACNTQQVV